MSVSPLFPPHQFFTIPGSDAAAAGYQLFFYDAGTSTKEATYTASDGGTANANPIVLDTDGTPPAGIYGTDGLAYKVVIAPPTDTDPPASGTTLIDNYYAQATERVVNTLAAAKALTGGTSYDIYVRGRTATGDGYEGMFYWDASDLSAKVAIDTVSGVYIPPDSDATGASGAWVRLHLDAVDVRWFGAVGDGTTDDTTAIQNADASANALSLPVIFQGADYVHTGLTWNARSWLGSPGYETRLLWDGTDGVGTAITRPSGADGGGSLGCLRDIDFRVLSTSNQPATILDIQASVDKTFELKSLRFLYSRGDAIKISNGWVNVQWKDLRFDDIEGWAINAVVVSSQNLSSFVLDSFTYDHNIASSTCEGMIQVDNSTANATNVGSFEVSNARVEVNQAWTGNQAVINYLLPASPAGSRSLGVYLRNIDYADAASMANDCLLYRDTANTTGRETLILLNIRTTGLSTILGGTWPSTQKLPSVPSSTGMMLINVGDFLNVGFQNTTYVAASGTDVAEVGVGQESYPRFTQRADGQMSWGSGAGAVDTTLARYGAGSIRCATGKFLADGGLGVGNTSANTNTPSGATALQMPVYSETGTLLGYIPIYGAAW